MVTISCSLHVADERFAFVDRYVGIADPGREVVDNVAGAQPHPAPMPRHPDVVNRLASDLHHADSVGDERLGPDVATGTRHHDPVEILDSLLLREPFADLYDKLLLYLGHPPPRRDTSASMEVLCS